MGICFDIEDSQIYYAYGCRLNNMTGILIIDTEKEIWINKQLPDGIKVETRMFQSFANKVLGQCIRGEIRQKVSREIG